MSIVKSFSVGNGDMFYIKHGSDNFTIIDCCLSDENKETIVDELERESKGKGVVRIISTHPDEDHILGLEYLDGRMGIRNFYCVRSKATKEDETESFKYYCTLRDGEHAYYICKGCSRRWMNESNDERHSSGINILWPDTAHKAFKRELVYAEDGASYNNISPVIRYNLNDGVHMLWLGDLETEFMEEIEDDISLSHVHVVFAPHHGRKSGKIPDSWLDRLKPRIIVIGEAPSRHLHYYTGYKTLTQNSAGDITFDCDGSQVHIYVSNEDYSVDFLKDEGRSRFDHYLGTLNL